MSIIWPNIRSVYKINLLVAIFIAINLLLTYKSRSSINRHPTRVTLHRFQSSGKAADNERVTIPFPKPLLIKDTNLNEKGAGHLTLRLYGGGGFSSAVGGRRCLQGSPLGVVVNSAPHHWKWRSVVRDTWGRELQRNNITVVFLMGTADALVTRELQDEHRQHGDIVVANFVDVYRNLTLKTVAMLEWLSVNCTGVHMVLKVDDDVVLNVPNLLRFVVERRTANNTFYGRRVQHWKPHRNRTSKYFISVKEYAPEEFPDYVTGPAYLFTRDIVRPAFEAALFTDFMFLEDVFLTGIVATKLGTPRKNVPEIYNRPTADPCYARSIISAHNMTLMEITSLYKQMKNITLLCLSPTRKRAGRRGG